MDPDDCTCPLCSIEIEVDYFDGAYFATSEYTPGLLWFGLCEEEAVGEWLV